MTMVTAAQSNTQPVIYLVDLKFEYLYDNQKYGKHKRNQEV